ncbi:class I SAM-dependent methyltransferase [Leucobacter insecticola]|uniref:Class I SAM-dependent methyltransferase n=1 Tax=Leucobacter insecticola TaxID=2714934 RepID=A0A6G8FLJ0_9MICO|nr:class I SAM-dependent methyltransferase [Leucobacter insecticola]QIM17159.1 class I SAM-dependent methyltransferase [Leucobacter insecticola]
METPMHSPFREIVAYLPGVVRSNLYEGYFARFYGSYTNFIDDDLKWYEAQVDSGRGLRVLDLFCGTGRIATYFANLGHHCTAIERSPDMLSFDVSPHDNVEMRLGDVFELEGSQSYDVAIAGQMSIAMFLDHSQRVELLRHIGRQLQVGGKLLFDMPLASVQNSSEVLALPLPENARGYVLSGVFRDLVSQLQTTYFLAELDAPDQPTARILASHQLVLLSVEELRDEVSLSGFEIEKLEVSNPTPLQEALTAPLARVSAVRRFPKPESN